MHNKLKIHSIESLGALDGPGLRMVIFMVGCPLRCMYCHNPDTWSFENEQLYDEDTLLKKILKMKSYFKNNGGVTFSGGDPLVQANALIPLFRKLKDADIHIALDTSGAMWNSEIKILLEYVDLVILDIKHTTEPDYHTLTNGHLKDTLYFLKQLISLQLPYWIRQVIVPKINDTKEQVQQLEVITRSIYREKIELLPYHSRALYKWKALGLIYPLNQTPEMKKDDLLLLTSMLNV